jgi:hypothetical protein
MAPNKPFFIQGAVETVVTQAANGQQHATDAIMKEIQQEETFKGFVQKLQKALHIQDRIMSRVPYFKVSGHPHWLMGGWMTRMTGTLEFAILVTA